MRSLIPRKVRPMRDPAPSKWGYRLQRWMLTPAFVRTLRVGTPLILLAVILGTFFANPDNRAMMEQRIVEAKETVRQRPEFMLDRLDVVGTDAMLEAQVRRVARLSMPISTFDVDLENLKARVTGLSRVKEATVRVGDGGALVVSITPRAPVAVWRDGMILNLLDADGVFSGALDARSDRPDLPLIAGEGAYASIEEALALFERAGPLGPRVRGLVRMGERRWDLVLDRDQRIQLPSENPGAALDRIIVLNEAHDLLDREVAVIDMRNGARPTVRLTTEATNALRRTSERRSSE